MGFLKTVINFRGIHRAGNHPVLEWIQTLYPQISFFNNITCTVSTYTNKVINHMILNKPPVLLLSYEDIPMEIAHTELQEYKYFNIEHFDNVEVINCILLRDLFNHMASYVKLEDFQCFEFMEFTAFIYLWKQYAKAFLSGDYVAISYNHWFCIQQYRMSLCEMLNGTYSELSLDSISSSGDGSSFKRDFFSSARKLPVMDNWRYFKKYKNFHQLAKMIDEEMLEMNRAIFGNIVDIKTMENELL